MTEKIRRAETDIKTTDSILWLYFWDLYIGTRNLKYSTRHVFRPSFIFINFILPLMVAKMRELVLLSHKSGILTVVSSNRYKQIVIRLLVVVINITTLFCTRQPCKLHPMFSLLKSCGFGNQFTFGPGTNMKWTRWLLGS